MMLGTFESSKRLFMRCVAWLSTYATEAIMVLNAMRTWNLLSYAYVLVTTLCWFLSVIWLQKLLPLCHHCPETTVYKKMKQKRLMNQGVTHYTRPVLRYAHNYITRAGIRQHRKTKERILQSLTRKRVCRTWLVHFLNMTSYEVSRSSVPQIILIL